MAGERDGVEERVIQCGGDRGGEAETERWWGGGGEREKVGTRRRKRRWRGERRRSK